MLYTSDICEGKRYDKKLADEWGYHFPAESMLVFQRKRKPRGSKLTEHDKIISRAISNLKSDEKHQIAEVKRYQILMQKSRNWVKNFVHKVMELTSDSHHYRLARR